MKQEEMLPHTEGRNRVKRRRSHTDVCEAASGQYRAKKYTCEGFGRGSDPAELNVLGANTSRV